MKGSKIISKTEKASERRYTRCDISSPAWPVLVAEDRDDHAGPEAPRESGYAGGRAVPPGR